jgi:hypothetical protein
MGRKKKTDTTSSGHEQPAPVIAVTETSINAFGTIGTSSVNDKLFLAIKAKVIDGRRRVLR